MGDAQDEESVGEWVFRVVRTRTLGRTVKWCVAKCRAGEHTAWGAPSRHYRRRKDAVSVMRQWAELERRLR